MKGLLFKGLGLLCLALSFYACNLEVENPQGGQVSQADGIKIEHKGLKAKRVYLEDLNQKPIPLGEFSYGVIFRVCFENVEGIKLKEDLKKFQMSATFRDSKGEVALKLDNLLGDDLQGVDVDFVSVPYVAITLASPLKSEQDYELEVKIWELNTDKSISALMPIKLRKDKNLRLESKGLKLDEAYIFDGEEKVVLHSETVNSGKSYVLILEGLDGFADKNGQVKPKVSVKMSSADGEFVSEAPDMLPEASYPATGIKERIVIPFGLPEGKKTAMSIETLILDGNSDKSLKVVYELKPR